MVQNTVLYRKQTVLWGFEIRCVKEFGWLVWGFVTLVGFEVREQFVRRQGLKMNYLAVKNSPLVNHRGSVPSVKAASQEVLHPRYQKRCSLDGHKGKSQQPSQLKWPSLLTIFKWRQSLEERLLKRHKTKLNCFQVMCYLEYLDVVSSIDSIDNCMWLCLRVILARSVILNWIVGKLIHVFRISINAWPNICWFKWLSSH